MATNKKTVSVYADDDLLTALEDFKDSGNHKSLNVAIVTILREKLFGESTDNVQSTLQGKVLSNLDIESMINEVIASRLGTIESNVRSLQLDRMSEKTDSLIIENLLTNLSITQNQISELSTKIESIENTRSEATATTNFTQALTSESEGSSVPKTDRSSIEPLPILDAIEALPTENPLPNETLRDAIAASDKPKSGKRSVKAKAILTRPEALAIAKNFGFNGTGQNLYDWSKAALTAKSDESRLANGEKLAVVGLVATFSVDKKPAWTV